MDKQVKIRFDHNGSEFGEIHRQLPIHCGMFDIDRMSAKAEINLELKKQEIGFLEYRTDFNRSTIEWKALFEIKYKNSEYVRKALDCKIGTPTWAQLELCKILKARYFFVIATNGKQPFEFIEIFYNGEFNWIGTLDYIDKEKDGKQAINDFWKNDIKLL